MFEEYTGRTTASTPPGGEPGGTGLESPSLFPAGTAGPPAFELKFLLTEDQARTVEDRLADRLTLDVHADPTLGNTYLTTTIYTDTTGFDVYHRTGTAGPSKYRVRRYGLQGPVFAEQKTRAGDQVYKRREALPSGGRSAFSGQELSADRLSPWFRDAVAGFRLRPVCRVAYDRVAYMGATPDGAVRLTFDRNVRGEPTGGWVIDPVRPAAADLLGGQVVCEFKFRAAIPDLFRRVVRDLDLVPHPVSKYRLVMATAGVSPREGAIDA
jgi:hypothetical protein